MRFNINTLQELAYTGTTGDMQTYSDKYLKQALANLGQRFSIKGDGVTNGKFAIYELMPDLPVPIDGDFEQDGKLYDAYMMATVVKDDDETLDINLTAYCVKDEQGEYYDETVSLNEDDYIVTTSDIYMPGAKVKSTSGGGFVAYYGTGGLISSPSRTSIKTAFQDLSYAGDLLDCSFNDYDLDNYRLQDGCRVTYNSGQTYFTAINRTDDGIILHLYTFEGGIEDAWNSIMGTSGPVMSGNNKYDWTASSIVSALGTLLQEVNWCYVSEDIATYGLMVDSDEITKFDSQAQRDVVEANVNQWNESLSKELPLFRSIYNEEIYFGSDDNLKLKKRLVAEIFASLYRNYVLESNGEAAEDAVFECLLPYDYEFIYTCNSQKTEQIYSSSRDMTVESVAEPEEKLWRIRQSGVDGVREQLIICSAWDIVDTAEDIYSTWKYFVTYDKEDVINSISVIRMYILPYINDDGYWNINGADTSIYARGKDGGQPSVIITYSDTSVENGHRILSTMHKDELTTALDWQSVYYRVRPLDTSTTVGADSFHMMTTYMPANISTSYLADNLVTFLENAIILDVASVHGEDMNQSTTVKPLSDTSELGPDATVTTFWALKKDEEDPSKYYFTYVKQPDLSWAVDFNYLADAEAIVRYYMQLGFEPDLYRHSWLVFDGVNATLKNQAEARIHKTTAYPTLMNRMREAFTDMFDYETSYDQYLNNLNFMLAFYNDVEFTGSYISAVNDTNSGRYFHFDSYEGSYVTPVIQTFYRNDLKIMSDDWMLNTHAYNTAYEESGIWWLDTLLPMLDFKETFLRNLNTLNRYNIISPSSTGEVYYSYIGTVYDSNDKSILHIGTSNEDINLGLNTLTTIEERSKFKKLHELDLDFEQVLINGDTVTPEHFWTLDEHDNGYVMFSTIMQLDYATSEMPRDVESLDDVAALESSSRDRLFRMPAQVSITIPDIGDGNTVEGKQTFVSYVNVNWLLQDVCNMSSMSDDKLKAGDASVTGEPGRLFSVLDENEVPSYFYKLSEDVADIAQLLDDTSAYYLVLSPLTLSYVDDYGTGRARVILKEHLTTTSTAYMMYDGGELQWED